MNQPTIPTIPLSLYIHMPWCVKKCPYCDFNSHAIRGQIPEDAYINALLADVKADLPYLGSQAIETIFIGGGTPSLFSGASYGKLFDGLNKIVSLSPNVEITLEANPGTVEQQRFKDYFTCGINRISLGIQSFSDQQLKALGRIHDASEAYKAIDAVTQAGFDNFNLDIMYGLPKQSVEEALQDLQKALQQHPAHLSWYHLTLEPNTLFHHNPPPIPDHDTAWEMQNQGRALLKSSSYDHYEVSAYSKRPCQHNMNYWQFGDYLGIGAGAHGKITQDGKVIRTIKHRHPKKYLETPEKTMQRKVVSQAEIPFEFMINALRLQQPVTVKLFEERTGLSFSTIAQPIAQAEAKGFLVIDQDNIQLTEMGHQFLNDVVMLFMGET